MAAKLTDQNSIEQILKEMTVEEKAACITGGTSFYSRAMEKYGIPALLWLDGGTGFNSNQKFLDVMYQKYADQREAEGNPIDEDTVMGRMGGLEIVLGNKELWESRKELAREMMTDTEFGCYPPGMFFAATWNPEVIEQCGRTLGKEANYRGVDVLLGTPNVNIHRDPLNGRLFEGYSEDPCLVSGLAPSFVKGIQEEGILADVKHFAANNQETDRMGVDEHISERALREIYLPGFEACIKENCRTIMSAYNQINGKPCAQNPWLLKKVLREEWGFDGCVVTDWSAAYDQVEAAAAGNDLVMPGPRSYRCLVDAVENGELSMEDLDSCVRNFLRIVLESPTMNGKRITEYTREDVQAGIQAAYNAAAEGITLLKNNQVLPLSKSAHVSFFGQKCKHPIDSGAGSAAVQTSLTTNVYDETCSLLGENQVSFESVNDQTTAVIVTVGVNGQEGADRPDMRMDKEDQEALEKALADARAYQLPVIVIMNIAGPIDMLEWEQAADAILCTYIPGMEGGHATADILFGNLNPSGKLPLTLPRKYSDCPSYGNFPGYDSEVWYGEGIYVGYRYYEKRDIPVMYPFGYGLSYTTFEIADLQMPEQIDLELENLTVKVQVKNTGSCAGAEVVQVYVRDIESTLDKPVKELKGFQKILLNPGEEKTVEIVLKKKDFAGYDTRLHTWATEPGSFEILVGNSSQNIAQKKCVEVSCKNPYAVGPLTDVIKVVSDPKALDIVEKKTELKLREVSGSYIVFQPLTPFKDIWTNCVRPALDVDDGQAAVILDEIYEEWSRL